jgi:hypothetical protein
MNQIPEKCFETKGKPHDPRFKSACLAAGADGFLFRVLATAMGVRQSTRTVVWNALKPRADQDFSGSGFFLGFLNPKACLCVHVATGRSMGVRSVDPMARKFFLTTVLTYQ